MTERHAENPPGALNELLPKLKEAYAALSSAEITERVARNTAGALGQPEALDEEVGKAAGQDFEKYQRVLKSCARTIINSIKDLTAKEKRHWLRTVFELAAAVPASDQETMAPERRSLFSQGLAKALYDGLVVRRPIGSESPSNPFVVRRGGANNLFDHSTGLPNTWVIDSLAALLEA